MIFRTIPHNKTVSDYKCQEFHCCISCPCTIQVFLKLTTPYTVCGIEMSSGFVEIIERIKFYIDHIITLDDPNFFSFQYFFLSLDFSFVISKYTCLN